MPKPCLDRSAGTVWLLAIVLTALAGWPAAGVAQAQDPSVVVLAPALQAQKETTEEQVRLELEISAFTPITAVKINGAAQAVPRSDYVTVSGTFPLVTGENKFLVEVDTEVGRTAREYVITRVITPSGAVPPPSEEKRFGLIAAGGFQNVSNVFHTQSDAQAGMRLFAIAIPSYVRTLDDTTALRVQGIFSRDRYNKADFASQEISFNQVTAARVKKLEGLDTWQLGGGLNLVDSPFKNILLYDKRIEQDLFAFGSTRRYKSDTEFNEYYGELKSVQLADQPSGDYNASGTILTGRGNFERELGNWHGRFLGSYALYSAGKYESRSILRASGEMSAPLSRLGSGGGSGAARDAIVGGAVRLRDEMFSASDPQLGKAANNLLLTYALLFSMPTAKNWIFSGEYALESQSSNVDGAKYNNSSLTATVIYVY